MNDSSVEDGFPSAEVHAEMAHQYALKDKWILSEIEKVKDPERKRFLLSRFSTPTGKHLFYQIMIGDGKGNRYGAHEFETGEWKQKLPKLTKELIEEKQRECIGGCGTKLLPITPWGDVMDYEHITVPICMGCLKTMNLEKLKDAMHIDEADWSVDKITSLKEEISKEVDTLKAALLKHLEKARTIYNVLTSPGIGLNVVEDVKIAAALKSFGVHHTNGIHHTNGNRANGTKPKGRATKPTNGERKMTERESCAKVLEMNNGTMKRKAFLVATEKLHGKRCNNWKSFQDVLSYDKKTDLVSAK